MSKWPCPLGTYGGSQMGKKDPSECLPCPAGYVCESEGLATLSGSEAPEGSY